MDDTVFKAPPSPPKPKTPQYQNDSILESLRTLGSGVGKSIAKDVTGKVASDALSSLFGAPVRPQGELQANRPLQFQKERLPFGGLRKPEMQPRAPYVRPEEPHLKEQIQAIQAELKALAASIKNLNADIQKTVTEVPVQPGIYHKNFYERIRSILRLLREQIDDSRTWLSLFNGKKQKRGYWGKYKKHGTSFGLSNERTVSTQSG